MAKRDVEKANIPEAALYSTKWFDYRFLRPHACDLAFLLAFATEGVVHNDLIGKTKYRNQLSKLDLDNYGSWRWRGFMTRLRMFADKHGIPYELYWQFSYRALRNMNFAYDTINIFANKALKEKTIQYWDEFELEMPMCSKAKIFRVELYKALDIQNKYFEFLTKRVVLRNKDNNRRIVSVLKRMIDDKKIPLIYVTENLKRISEETNG